MSTPSIQGLLFHFYAALVVGFAFGLLLIGNRRR